mmetsp:Transcript_10947/g.38481  ORF Transcript_10947/g.38481 Transcript_10947/m.38481 type:complete len:200 (+) Transcript_10947:145-744(+)
MHRQKASQQWAGPQRSQAPIVDTPLASHLILKLCNSSPGVSTKVLGSGLALDLEALQAVDATVDLDQVVLGLPDVVRQAVPARLVIQGVVIRELDLRHVLLESPHHGQFEERLREQLHLIADLRPDEAVSLQHQHLHLVHGLVNLARVHGDVREPLRQHRLGAGSALNLLGNALLGVVEAGEHGIAQVVLAATCRRAAL